MFVCFKLALPFGGAFLFPATPINIEKLKINVKIFLQFKSFVLYLYQQTN
jgi:hypothetical protein